MKKLSVLAGALIRFARRKPVLSLGCGALAIALVLVATTLFSADNVTRDFSAFETYEFKQTHGLGFCSDPDRPHSAKITRNADGTMAFSHALLALAGTDPEQCDGGVATDDGCLRPNDQPPRQLSPQEADQVTAVFAQTTYHRRPDPLCREYGIDPCMIERHVWDGKELSDFLCGSDRLTGEHDTRMRDLLIDLKSGG